MKKYSTLIGLGLLNLLHSSMHVIQFVQSILLISVEHSCDHETGLEHFLHNPVLNIVWVLVAIFTMYLGIRDYRHHKKCEH